MSPELVFLICNYGVLPAWALLILAPKWQGTQTIVQAIWIPLLLGGVYTFYLFNGLNSTSAPEGGSMATLPGLMILFSSPTAVLAGWIHYLAFDLFVGAWVVRDSHRRDLKHVYVIPCLIAVLMAGPFGLLAYLLLRVGLGKGGVSLAET